MVNELRSVFNKSFSDGKYNSLIESINKEYPGALDFRNAETPVFVPKEFTDKMLHVCNSIVDVILRDDFKKLTERSIPDDLNVPAEDAKPQCLVFDFGVCRNENGNLEPQLIEMQAFPSLFCFQMFYDELVRQYADVPENYSAYLNGFDKESYIRLLKNIIIGDESPENVILLEIYPHLQKTRIDFECTKKMLGIEIVCLSDVFAEGRHLYYKKNGEKVLIKRIFNRIIFDDLRQQEGWEKLTDLTGDYDVKWIPHPNWFYRISKFTLPFIDHPNVPETFFLNEITQPLPLEDYVLKPLFSFAGMGVVIDVTQEDIDKIKDPENWILQKKVEYADAVETPDGNAKVEIRLFFFWDESQKRPVAVHNLARLSKGKMIGTRYNKNKTWVGGSIAYFEK